MPFYIHIHDPQFAEAPWPGQRRFGPYGSDKQALEQAASDVAQGAGEGVIGIFTGTESQKFDGDLDPTQDFQVVADLVRVREGALRVAGKATMTITREQIDKRAEELVAERTALAMEAVADLRENVRVTLPENMREDEALLDRLMQASGVVR